MNFPFKFRLMTIIKAALGFLIGLVFINVGFLCLFQWRETKVETFHPPNTHEESESATHSPALCSLSKLKEASSAVRRADSAACKLALTRAACRLREVGSLHKVEFVSTCPLLTKTIHRKHEQIGCFKDKPGPGRLFKGGYYSHNTTNTPALCVESCFRLGYPLAGVQYGRECFCGVSVPSNATSGEFGTNCVKYSCPGDKYRQCGGHWWMAVYHTGFNEEIRAVPKPEYVELEDIPDGKPVVRIAFFLALNGRNDRQIKRMLRLIYRPHHYYYIHIDERQDYLHREISNTLDSLPNVFITSNRFSSIWGGASLLTMYLTSIKEILDTLDWNWDYVLNLSETCMPLISVEEVEAFLTVHNGSNFVRSHGISGEKFLSKQGLLKTFYECDRHLWRIGDRPLLRGVWMDGGSDWFVLGRSFMEYVLYSDDDIVTGLKDYYQYSLLPAESFFHTLLHNSKYCATYRNANLKFTNWKKGQGCMCQYNHAVDWCGCSPKTFEVNDIPRLSKKKLNDKTQYFGRKFDPIIDVNVINFLERRLLAVDELDYDNLDSVWFNDWCYLDANKSPSAKLNLMKALARQSLAKSQPIVDWLHSQDSVHAHSDFSNSLVPSLMTICPICDMDSVLIKNLWYYQTDNQFKGLVLNFDVTCGGNLLSLEALIFRKNSYTFVGEEGLIFDTLETLEVGSQFDGKELFFRDKLGGIPTDGQPILRHVWQQPRPRSGSVRVTIVLENPKGKIVDSSSVKVDDVKVVQTYQIPQPQMHDNPTFQRGHLVNLTGNSGHFKKYLPGIWKLSLLHDDQKQAEIKFAVIPSDMDDLQLLWAAEQSGLVGPTQIKGQRQMLSMNLDGSSLRTPLKFGPPPKITDAIFWEFMAGLVDEFYEPNGLCVQAKPLGRKGNFRENVRARRDLDGGLSEQKSDQGMLSGGSCGGLLSSGIPLCSETKWSSFAPDPKSQFWN